MKSCTIGLWLLMALASLAWSEEAASLARALAAEGDPAGAAVEYRRLALQADASPEQGAWYWMAGYAYGQAGQLDLADRMLDRAEDADPALTSPALVLRGEHALVSRDFDAATFYFESTLRSLEGEDPARAYAGRRLAVAELQRGNIAGARAALAGGSGSDAARRALDDYEAGRDRHPAVGGWLGAVPGLGYAYAGEYANALRSLLLNGLFIWGMVSTAEEEQWGGFAVITFFEITWYTGSIYGGVDASHRYNRKRLSRAVEAISAGAVMTPDHEALPALRLKYSF